VAAGTFFIPVPLDIIGFLAMNSILEIIGRTLLCDTQAPGWVMVELMTEIEADPKYFTFQNISHRQFLKLMSTYTH
jgi:hypothetical protein